VRGEPGQEGRQAARREQGRDDAQVEGQHAGEERRPQPGLVEVLRAQGEAERAQGQHDQEAGEPLDQDAARHRGASARGGGEHEPGRVAADAGRQEVAGEHADPVEPGAGGQGESDPGREQEPAPLLGRDQDAQHAGRERRREGQGPRPREGGRRLVEVDREAERRD
jgi:hypothetical protein